MHIPELREKVWVIVVDEIERAQFDEIYRLVEAMERFKNEGRTGLPIRIVFILCISRPDFLRLIETFKGIDPRAFLIKKFFFDDPKSFTNTLYLPPVSYETKKNWVIKKIENFIISNGITYDIEKCNPNSLTKPSREFMNELEGLGYLLSLLMQGSPRVLERCLEELSFFQTAYREASGKKVFESVFFGDLLALSLIKIQYPYLIDFFKETLPLLLPADGQELLIEFERQEKFIDKKKALWDWIVDVSPELTVSDLEKLITEELINLVARSWVDFLNKSGFSAENRLAYDKRTSDPRVMRDYLSLCSNSTTDHFELNKEILSMHQTSDYDFTLLSPETLLGYSRFIKNTIELSASKHLDVVKELSRRLKDGKIPIQPCNIGSTIYDEILYQFIFQIVEVTEIIDPSNQPSQELLDLFKCWKEVLLSKNMTSGGKLIIINSYFNFERERTGDIHHRLLQTNKLFKKYFFDEMKTIVSSVFQELDNRYLDGEDIIYEKEENFFFTLFQRWSGDPNNSEEIDKIRNTVRRGLETRPDVVSLYWAECPSKEDVEWPGLLGKEGMTLYIPLPELFKITDVKTLTTDKAKKLYTFWKSVWEDDKQKEKYQQLFELKKSQYETLYSILKKQGYLV